LLGDLGDRHGQLRCYTNIGILQSRAGDVEAAERSYSTALDLGRRAHAPDLAGAASLNLGVLYMQSGTFDRARERFSEALRLFAASNNEPHRLIALFNMANLARERGDAVEALALYDASAALARTLGQVDIEIGARAGAGLASLSSGDHTAAAAALEDGLRHIGEREDWWFQGRELIEALRVRLALAGDSSPTTGAGFHDALLFAERHDQYSAAWLLGECAEALAAAGHRDVWQTVERYAPRIEALGYAPLSARYEAFGAARAAIR
jgi:tetratricopeptide (TPR) repeat protein